MFILFFSLLFLQDIPDAIQLKDQHGQTMTIQPDDGSTRWLVLGWEPKTARLMGQWLKSKDAGFLAEEKGVCVADITRMPKSIKEKRFLPRVRAFPLRIFLIDHSDTLQWVPRQSGSFTLIRFDEKGKPLFSYPRNIPSLVKLLELEI